MNVIKTIFSIFHKHKWEDCGWNIWNICIEQKCKCGIFRHHKFVDLPKWFGDEPTWHLGRHPSSFHSR